MSANNSRISIVPKMKVENNEDLDVAGDPGSSYVSEMIIDDPRSASSYTNAQSVVAVVSDGSRVGDLGNLGPEGVFNLLIEKASAINSYNQIQAMPLSIRQRSIEEMYNTIKNIKDSFGVINLESIDETKAAELESLLVEDGVPVLNDNLKIVPVIILAILLNGLELSDRDLKDIKIVIDGTDDKALMVVDLLIAAGVKDIIVINKNGIITPKDESLSTRVRIVAGTINPDLIEGTLADGLKDADVYINTNPDSGFKREYIETMISPIIIDYSHQKIERYELLHRYRGSFVLATYRPDLENFVTPFSILSGVLKGMVDGGIKSVSTDLMLRLSDKLAKHLELDEETGKVLPDIFDPEIQEKIKEFLIEYNNKNNRI